MKGKIARFIEAISSLLLKMKNGKSQKRRRDFKENRKRESSLGIAFGENWLLIEQYIQPIGC